MNADRLPLAKPESSKTIKRRKQRFAYEVINRVRAHDVERDGYCRWQNVGLGDCDGPSEWAHWGEWKRFKTRGQEPEKRHTAQGTMMMCKRHHNQYDAGTLAIEALSDAGCEGRMRATWFGPVGADVYAEPIDE